MDSGVCLTLREMRLETHNTHIGTQVYGLFSCLCGYMYFIVLNVQPRSGGGGGWGLIFYRKRVKKVKQRR